MRRFECDSKVCVNMRHWRLLVVVKHADKALFTVAIDRFVFEFILNYIIYKILTYCELIIIELLRIYMQYVRVY